LFSPGIQAFEIKKITPFVPGQGQFHYCRCGGRIHNMPLSEMMQVSLSFAIQTPIGQPDYQQG